MGAFLIIVFSRNATWPGTAVRVAHVLICTRTRGYSFRFGISSSRLYCARACAKFRAATGLKKQNSFSPKT